MVRSVDVHWKSLTLGAIPQRPVGRAVHPTVTAQIAVINRGNTFFNILHGSTTFSSGIAAGGSGTDVKAPHYTILPGIGAVRGGGLDDPPFIGWTHLADPPLLQRHRLRSASTSPANVADHPVEPAGLAGVAGRRLPWWWSWWFAGCGAGDRRSIPLDASFGPTRSNGLCFRRMRAAVFTGAEPAHDNRSSSRSTARSPGRCGLTMLASGVCRSDLHVLDGDWAVAGAGRARPRGLRAGRHRR